jgi:FkbM family methyltransferase
MAQEIFIFGTYERGTREFIVNCLPERGTYVDVGANIGALAIPIAKARPEASIVCLEADPSIHSILKENLRRNHCERVQALSCVAGEADSDGVPFYRAPSASFGMGSLGPQFGKPPIMLKQRTLDSVLTEIDIHSVDVMKVDVEGAELAVLRGAQQLLSSERAPVVVFEFIDWAEARISGQQPGDAQRDLLSKGFRLFQLSSDGRISREHLVPICRGFAMLIAFPPRTTFSFQ